MIDIRRAEDRASTSQDGITSWHAFSSGPHFDPDNTGFGPLIAFDEHLLAPGAAFAEHAHRGVDLVTWVLEGTLRHEQPGVHVRHVTPGYLAHQDAGSGVRHIEGNASADQPLRFVQMALLTQSDTSGYSVSRTPLRLTTGLFAVHEGQLSVLTSVPRTYVHVVSGDVHLEEVALAAGDSARLEGESLQVGGRGTVLFWHLYRPSHTSQQDP